MLNYPRLKIFGGTYVSVRVTWAQSYLSSLRPAKNVIVGTLLVCTLGTLSNFKLLLTFILSGPPKTKGYVGLLKFRMCSTLPTGKLLLTFILSGPPKMNLLS